MPSELLTNKDFIEKWPMKYFWSPPKASVEIPCNKVTMQEQFSIQDKKAVRVVS